MRFNHLIEAMYEGESIFRNRNENRIHRYTQIINKKIQNYIANGSTGYLQLANIPFKTLPDNLKKVDQFLYIEGSQIQYLPKGLVINGSLFADNSKLQHIDNISVKNNIFARFTPIDHLPENLVLRSHLILTGCIKLKNIPRGLKVRVLNIERTAVSTLPDDIEVEIIYFSHTPLVRNTKLIKHLQSRGIRVIYR